MFIHLIEINSHPVSCYESGPSAAGERNDLLGSIPREVFLLPTLQSLLMLKERGFSHMHTGLSDPHTALHDNYHY